MERTGNSYNVCSFMKRNTNRKITSISYLPCLNPVCVKQMTMSGSYCAASVRDRSWNTHSNRCCGSKQNFWELKRKIVNNNRNVQCNNNENRSTNRTVSVTESVEYYFKIHLHSKRVKGSDGREKRQIHVIESERRAQRGDRKKEVGREEQRDRLRRAVLECNDQFCILSQQRMNDVVDAQSHV